MREGWWLERIKAPSLARGIMLRVGAVALALLTSGLALAAMGHDPVAMAGAALSSTLGSSFGLQDLGTLTTPLLLTGLAAMVAMRVNLWNIGGEGQLYMGAWAAAGIGIFCPGPSVLILPLMLLAGAIAGMVWIALPALAKAHADVDEIITTLLMNFIAILFVGFFASGPWRDPAQTITASSLPISHSLPELFGYMNIGILIALVSVIILWLIFTRTVWGFETTYVGANAVSARYAGIPSSRRVLTTMFVSGALAGLAGAIEVSGTVSRLQVGLSSQFGYIGIVIAALAAGSFPGIVVGAVLMALLVNAGIILETEGLSINAVVALMGWMLLAVGVAQIASGFRLRRNVKLRKGHTP